VKESFIEIAKGLKYGKNVEEDINNLVLLIKISRNKKDLKIFMEILLTNFWKNQEMTSLKFKSLELMQ